MAEEDLLSCLLDVASAEFNFLSETKTQTTKSNDDRKSKEKTLSEVDLFSGEQKDENSNRKKENTKSLIHDGDTDSSEDESKKNYENSKYNDYGKEIKSILSHFNESGTSTSMLNKKTTNNSIDRKQLNCKTDKNVPIVHTDAFFGINVINPLISSKVLNEKMIGRKSISINNFKILINTIGKDDDWVVAGVICNRSLTKTSSKGHNYVIWTLTDLLGDIKTVSLFLFGNAYKELWKTQIGNVVGILNPKVLEQKSGSKDLATISIDNKQKIIILGQSKDFDTCKSKKKNGDRCTNYVNKSKCEYCVYHVKQEYQKFSLRSDLQTSYSGKGLIALRNKVLGKNEVFYAGKSYTSIPAKQSKKLLKKDQNRLQNLSGNVTNVSTIKKKKVPKAAASFDVCKSQRLKDLETLKKLGIDTEKFNGNHSTEVTSNESKSNAVKILSQLKGEKNDKLEKSLNVDSGLSLKEDSSTSSTSSSSKNLLFSNLLTNSVPSLKKTGETIDFTKQIIPRRAKNAKLKALDFVKKNGQIQKNDPNNVCKKSGTSSSGGVKRTLELNDDSTTKKFKKIHENEFLSDRFKKMMELQTKHLDLVEMEDRENQEKYFEKLEKKEEMEEKMLNIYKIDCKAVRCLDCKYTSFSSSEKCKLEKHRLKVYDAFKRFFKCGNCNNRIACLDIVPLNPCNNCNDRKWQRTTMIKEKIVNVTNLSIRGGEQKYTNSVVTDANVNLMVPDDN